MGKKITIASYDIDIKGIEQKLTELRGALNEDAMGGDFTKKLQKEISALETQLEKVRNAYPGAGATQKQIDLYNKKMESLRIAISSFGKGAVDSFDDSNDYIKKNIKSLEEYVNKVAEVNAELDKIKEGKKVPELNVSTRIGKTKENVKSMKEAAESGDRAGVLAAYDSYSKKQNTEIRNLAKTKGKDSEEYKTAVADRENVHAIEKAYIQMAENVIAANKRLAAAQQDESDAVEKAKVIQKQALQEIVQSTGAAEDATKKVQVQLSWLSDEARRVEDASRAFDAIEHKIKNLVSAGAVFGFLSRAVRNTIQDMLELDKQFNEIAIVSDYSTKEMWKSFDNVNRVAQEFGVETKNVIEVQNLYYHQGKSMSEVNKLTAQTLTLAKITGMEYADATSKLTAVLNAYNIAAEDAVRVTDTIAAMDTNAAISSEELMTALTKTASIAANAGMSLESTEVFLTKMIETTREAPENLGTALKTIIARFGEVKQEVDGEFVELADINRVDTALKSVGISLLDSAGQIRDLDKVFMELSSQWDGLDRNTQRYIATIAAGSRQQSRFIAMMEDYDRTLELTNIAQDSAGLGARQLAKSQESLESSISRLKSSLQALAQDWVKAGSIKNFIEMINSLVNAFSKLPTFIQPIVAGLALVILKFKVLNPLFARYKIISEGFIKGTDTATIAQELLEQKEIDRKASLTNLIKSMMEASGVTKALTKDIKNLKEAETSGVDADNKLSEEVKDMAADKNDNNDGEEYVQDLFEGYLDKPDSKVPGPEVPDPKVPNPNPQVVDNVADDVAEKGFKDMAKDKAKEVGKSLVKTLKSGITKLGKWVLSKLPWLAKKVGETAATAVGGALVGAILAALATALLVWKYGFKASLDDTKHIEKLSEAQDKYNSSLKEYNDLKQKSKKYKDYLDPTGKVKTNLSEEEKQEEQNLAKELVEEYPRLLDYIDEEGNYHLKNANAIEKEIAAKEKMLKQASDTYLAQRMENAKRGIYTDTSTLAGQSMKNMQDYAATFGTEKLNKNNDLKEIAKSVDEGFNNFNKSGFYDIMEAYAKGEKASFDEKDMSDLFAGDIGQTNWKKFLKLLNERVYSQGGTLDQKTMAELLNETGAYVGDQAKEVAKSFMLLDEQLGGMYSSLLEGAALENAEILIQSAKMEINTFDFQSDIGDALKTTIAETAEKEAKRRAGDAWDKKSEEKKEEAIEAVLNEWQPDWENVSKENLSDYEKLISEDTINGIAASTVTSSLAGQFSADETDISEMRKDLIDYISTTAIEGLDAETIQNATDTVILTLFNKVAIMIEDAVEIDKKFSEFAVNFGSDVTELKEQLTLDQQKAFMEKTSSLDDESQQSFFNMVNTEFNKQLATGGLEKANKLFNTLLKIDFSSDSGLPEATKLLQEFGYTGVDVASLFITAMGNINNISMSTFEQTIETTQQLIEKTVADLEGMGALIEGTATSAQLSSYFNFMGDNMLKTMDIDTAVDEMIALGMTITATGEGFKLAEEAALKYGNQVVSSTQEAILGMMALQKAIMENKDATADARMEAAKSYAFLAQAYSQADVARQKAYWDGVIDNLEKVKEKADEALEAIKGLVSWMRDFDRFSSLDGVIKDLENDFGHIEFEISFTTNADVVEKDIEKQITNANTRLAANRGGLAAAEDEQAMWRDTIQKRNSQYISFDANGNAILNHKEIQNLQEKMANADPETRKIYQAQYDEIMGNYDAYNKATDKVEEYSKAVEESMKDIEEIMTTAYENVTKTQEKLIETRMKQEDKELEKIKDKYEAIKEENDKYLESVKDMIDEERAIRDRADKEQDVKDKEKKLAMMKMDTSGVYSNDIRALEEELEGDYRSLEDDAIDRAIEGMEKQFDAQAEAMDKEIEYMENALEYKREVMTEYNEWAIGLIEQGSDAVLAYLKANDEEYYTGSAAQQALWEQEWNSNVALAVGSNEVLKDSLIQSVFNTLESCKENANGFEGAVEEYSETAIANNGAIEDTVNILSDSYEGLATRIDGVADAMQRQAAATESAARAAWDLKNAQDASKNIVGAQAPDVSPAPNGNSNYDGGNGTYKSPTFGKWSTNENENVYVWVPQHYEEKGAPVKGKDGVTYVPYEYTDTAKGTSYIVWFRNEDLDYNKDAVTGKNRPMPKIGARWYRKYATGGLADYTGPAWLDGTPSKPEMVLNPAQTTAFIKLVDILDLINSPIGRFQSSYDNPKTYANAEALKNEYNFTINVDQMASDYDVDQLINRIEEKMIKASRYRNVTTLTKKTL